MDKILEVTDLVKKYNDDAGVDSVSFSLKPGRILAYLGHNGAGKTTTVRAVLGLLKMNSGTVSYEGRVYDTDSADYDRVRVNYGVCLDTPGFYGAMPALKNLELFAGLYGLSGEGFRARAEELLKRLELYEVRNNPVKTFSKGMAQKLALARALMHKPRVLFLDEPMSGLDPAARVLMREFLKELAVKERVAVFLTSHDLNEVEQMADEVFILEKGRVILSGGLRELKASFMKSFGYALTLGEDAGEERAAAIAASLGAVKQELAGGELRVDCPGELTLEAASAACAKAGVKMTEFRRLQVNLEKIYFDSVKRNENKN